jgi:hypothetical protein
MRTVAIVRIGSLTVLPGTVGLSRMPIRIVGKLSEPLIHVGDTDSRSEWTLPARMLIRTIVGVRSTRGQ